MARVLPSPPSETEILNWFRNYKTAFSLTQSHEELVTSVSKLYVNVFEQFKRSRVTVGRNSTEARADLYVFGFDYFDAESDTSIRFYSKYNVPELYRPLPTSGSEFREELHVIWPKHEDGRWLASYIRNSFAHQTTEVMDGLVIIENRRDGSVPNFRVFLPVKEYIRLIAGSLKYFVEHAVLDNPNVNKLGFLSKDEYCKLVEFFQVFLRELPTKEFD